MELPRVAPFVVRAGRLSNDLFGKGSGMTCPMCKAVVAEFKKNCHVLPRAWAKRTKIDGRNIAMDFRNDEIAVNQSDYSDDYWCADCETVSAADDAYGAEVLLHGTQGVLKEIKGNKIDWKELSGVDYIKLKKFALSVAIRDHLARGLRKRSQILSTAEFDHLREEYLGKRDSAFIVGSYVRDSEPLSKALTPPVRTNGNDGVNFQLFNYCIMIYFKPKAELVAMSLQRSGEMRLPMITSDQAGNLKAVGEGYQRILDNPKNEKQLAKIKKKYP